MKVPRQTVYIGRKAKADAWLSRRPQTRACAGAQGFAEADIQSLKEAVALSRQEAVEALRHSAGDLHAAFLNELGALRHNTALLDDLVMSYAAQRCQIVVYGNMWLLLLHAAAGQ